MAQSEVLRLIVEVDTATGEAKLQRFSGQVEKTSKDSKKHLTELGEVAKDLERKLAAAFTVEKIIEFTKESYVEFARLERQWHAIEFQLKSVADATAGLDERTRKSIESLSRQSGILDEKLIPAYARLLLGTQNAAQAQDLLTIATRFASNGYGDVQANAERLASFFQTGMIRTLVDFGIHTKETGNKTIDFAEAVRQLTERFNALPKKVDDAQARLDNLARTWSDVKHASGEALDTMLKFMESKNKLDTLFTGALLKAAFLGVPGALNASLGRLEDQSAEDARHQAGVSNAASRQRLPAALDLPPGPGSQPDGETEEEKLKKLLAAATEATDITRDFFKSWGLQPAIQGALDSTTQRQIDIDTNLSGNGVFPFDAPAAPGPVGPSLEDRDAEIEFADALTVKYTTLKEAVDALTAAKDRLRAAGLQVTDSQEQQIASAETAAQSFEAQARVVGVLTQTQQVLSTVSQAAAIAAGKSSKTQFEVMKAVALASAIVNTARAIVEVLPNYYLAAAVAVAGALQIYKIISTHPGSSSAPSTGGGGGGGGSNRWVGPAAGARTFNESGPVGGSETQDRHNGRKEHHVNVKIEAMDGKSVADVVNSKAFRRAVGRAADQAGRRG